MASEPSSSISRYVFISFRGEDTRKNFTDHLYTALVGAGLRTFRDDDEIERGENIKSELERAIKQSRSSVIVLSKDYASSGWCLDELVMIVEQRRTVGHVILPVFYDVDPSNVRKQTGTLAEAFERHEAKFRVEIDERKRKQGMEKMGLWRKALGEVADLGGMVLQNQADRGLIEVNKDDNKLIMHQVLRDMGREIVRRESQKEPGKRSRVWCHKDAFNVLRDKTGTATIEGLSLNLEDMPAKRANGAQSQNEDFLAEHTMFNEGNSLKRRRRGLFSFLLVILVFTESFSELDEDDLKTDAFSQMHNLRLLQLNNVRLSGRYQKFPKKLRWLSWHGFPLKSIPNDFTLDSLVALEMQNSSLEQLWKRTKLPNLERLILKYCINLVGIHESIGELGTLVLLNLEGCKNLRKLPKKVFLVKSLELILSRCSMLDGLLPDLGKMESLKVLHADGTN